MKPSSPARKRSGKRVTLTCLCSCIARCGKACCERAHIGQEQADSSVTSESVWGQGSQGDDKQHDEIYMFHGQQLSAAVVFRGL